MYKDISYFASEEIISNQYMASSYSVVSLPNLNIDKEFTFNGNNFILTYNFDSVYDYSNFSLNLNLDNGIDIKKKVINNLEKFRTIILDEYNGEIGNLSILGELEFQDDLLDSYKHKIPITNNNYDMTYKLNVTALRANLTGVITDTIPLSFEFNYLLPNDYSIAIYNLDKTIDEKITLRDSYYLNKVSSNNGGTIIVSILSPDGSEFKKVGDYKIYSVNEIKSSYTEPTFTEAVLPGYSVVTYNDDDTINLYRKVGFSSTDPNIYLDAVLFDTNYEDPSTGEMQYLNAIHNKTVGTYSIIEDLVPFNYCYIYFVNYDKDGVIYQMNKADSSGHLVFTGREPITYEVSYDETSDSTKLIIRNDFDYNIKNQIIIDNIYYYFIDYTARATTYKALIPGNVIGKQMNLSMTLYDENYDSYSIDCEMKGNRYKTYTFDINI